MLKVFDVSFIFGAFPFIFMHLPSSSGVMEGSASIRARASLMSVSVFDGGFSSHSSLVHRGDDGGMESSVLTFSGGSKSSSKEKDGSDG